MGEQQHALDAYSLAIAREPSQPLFWFNRATVQRFLGRLAAAEEDYDRVIALRPDDCEAYSNRSDLRKQSRDRNHIEAMERLLAAGIAHWRGEVQLRHALAKEYEDLEQYSDSWRHLEKGARLRREHLQYDVRHDVDTVDWIMKAFPDAPGEPANGCPSREPIFIVGLPRSGTTLVERILGSHSQVFAAGELNNFAAALVSAAMDRSGGRSLPRAQLVGRDARAGFWSTGRRLPGEDAATHLATALLHRQDAPELPVLRVDPAGAAQCADSARDSPPHGVLLRYVQDFVKDGYPFSYDLDDVARYYVGYRRLMGPLATEHAGRHLRHQLRAVGPETRRVKAGACSRRAGSNGKNGCLEFHRNPTVTTTASASQVRRPIYDSSLQQWRHYEGQLAGCGTNC